MSRGWTPRGRCAGATALAKPGAWADNPWEQRPPVFKVGPGERGKIFAFLGGEGVGVKAGDDPRGGRRVAAPLPRQRVGDGLHRPLRAGTTSPSTGRSPTTSSSRPSTSPTGWWSRSCRRSSAPTAGTRVVRTFVLRVAQASSGFSVAPGDLADLRRLGRLRADFGFGGSRALAWLRSSFSIRPSMMRRLAGRRREQVGAGRDQHEDRPDEAVVAGHEPDRPDDQVGDQEPEERLAAASRRSRAGPGARGRPRERAEAAGTASAVRSRDRRQQLAVRLGRRHLRRCARRAPRGRADPRRTPTASTSWTTARSRSEARMPAYAGSRGSCSNRRQRLPLLPVVTGSS